MVFSRYIGRFGVRKQPTAQAYKLVRILLAEKSRPFQELLSDGIALHETKARPESSAAAAAAAAAAQSPSEAEVDVGQTGRKGHRIKQNGRWYTLPEPRPKTRVPEGHPWVSAAYLKNRILPILESQGLVMKKSVEGQYPFRLADRTNFPSEQQWDRLLSGTDPAQLKNEFDEHMLFLKEELPNEPLRFGAARASNKREKQEEDMLFVDQEVREKLHYEHLNAKRLSKRIEQERDRRV